MSFKILKLKVFYEQNTFILRNIIDNLEIQNIDQLDDIYDFIMVDTIILYEYTYYPYINISEYEKSVASNDYVSIHANCQSIFINKTLKEFYYIEPYVQDDEHFELDIIQNHGETNIYHNHETIYHANEERYKFFDNKLPCVIYCEERIVINYLNNYFNVMPLSNNYSLYYLKRSGLMTKAAIKNEK
ncbi:hypothetical protein Hokovirus_2_9 [Hokovirus HKV1]|uniref:Uncharacterized protein n=1 Tax=Hokovirus HKV1 TaxID=1977638 RepID=A0A1V0SFJ2_9VIRU|nr:hypothetical protein Hokovirus_2_9 [Hokovirus HKV1]